MIMLQNITHRASVLYLTLILLQCAQHVHAHCTPPTLSHEPSAYHLIRRLPLPHHQRHRLKALGVYPVHQYPDPTVTPFV